MTDLERAADALDTPTSRYRPYDDYQDSGIAWLGEIPAYWTIWKLSHAFKQIGSGTTPDTNKLEYFDGDIAWVTTSELRENVITSTLKTVTVTALRDHSALTIYKPGTLLIAMYGATIGRLGILGVEACTNQACCALADSNVLDTRFTFYWLLYRRELIINLSSGGGQPNINQEKIRSIRIPVPPPDEQRAIATFLDRETAKLDALIAKKRDLITTLTEQRSAIISHAVTKGLDPDAPMKDSGVEWLGEIPAGWEVRRLIFAAKLESGHTPSRSVAEYWENCDIPWVSLNDVGALNDEDYILDTENYINSLGLANSSARMLPAGTVILSRDATIGRAAILGKSMATAQHFVNWICYPELDKEYLLFLIREPMQQEFDKLTMGSTIKTIGLPEVRQFTIPLPPVHEQKRIVDHVKQNRHQIDGLIKNVNNAIAMLQEYRAALISAAVTGKIDVRGEV